MPQTPGQVVDPSTAPPDPTLNGLVMNPVNPGSFTDPTRPGVNVDQNGNAITKSGGGLFSNPFSSDALKAEGQALNTTDGKLTLAAFAAAGGIAALAGAGAAAGGAVAAAPVFDANGFAIIAPQAVPTLALSPVPGVFTADAAAWAAPVAVTPAASGWGSLLSAASSTGSAIKDAATISLAAKSAVSPWQKAITAVTGLVSPSAPAAGGTVVVSPGATPQAVSASLPSFGTSGVAAAVQKAAASPLVLVGGSVAALATIAFFFFKPKRLLA